VTPKQTVRNVESALIAHLGMRVSHKKISVATSNESRSASGSSTAPAGTSGYTTNPTPPNGVEALIPLRSEKVERADAPKSSTAAPATSNLSPSPHASAAQQSGSAMRATPPQSMPAVTPPSGQPALTSDLVGASVARRRLYFEDIEVRRSRSKGVACRVTLRKGEQAFVGEAEGLENERLRIELAARATLSAITQAEGDARVLGLEGCKTIEAFDRQFVFVGLTTRTGREAALLTGSAEVKESQETASVLAVLDATNRWIDYSK
jgi:hypothetical protein